MSQYDTYPFDPSQWGFQPGAPQWPSQPGAPAPGAPGAPGQAVGTTTASPSLPSTQNGFPSPLQLPNVDLAPDNGASGAAGADDAARRGSGGSDALVGGVKAEDNNNNGGGAGSPNPDASSAAAASNNGLPAVPAELYAHLQQLQHQHAPPHFPPAPYYPHQQQQQQQQQYALPSPAAFQHVMQQQQQQQMAAVAQAQAAAQRGQGQGEGAEGKVDENGEGKNAEYTPTAPYITNLRASTSSSSGRASPTLPSTSSSAAAPAPPPYPTFPSTLVASLNAYTGAPVHPQHQQQQQQPSPFGGIPGLNMGPYAAAAHLNGPLQPHHLAHLHQQQQQQGFPPHLQQQQPHSLPHSHQPSPQPQPGSSYKEGEPPELPFASDDSADEDFGASSAGAGGGGSKGKARASRGRARARKDSNNNTPSAVTPSGFAIPRAPGVGGSSVVGEDEDGGDGMGVGTRDPSVGSSASAGASRAGSGSRSRKRPLDNGSAAGSGTGTPLLGGGAGGEYDDADGSAEDVDPAVLAGLEPGQRLPGQGFAPPRARRQTEIPAVEDDPSVRPYGCNYCAPAGVPLASLAGTGAQNSWRTIKELREHHTAVHKERQRILEEAGDEAVMMEMPFRCALDPCGKTFKSLAGLRFHFQNASANGHFFVHLERDEDTGEERATKKFKQEVKPSGRELGCPVGRCPKRFKQSAGLAYHLSHTANHPITLSMLSTFEATLQSKTKWWFNRLGKEFAPEPGAAPAAQPAAASAAAGGGAEQAQAQGLEQPQDVYGAPGAGAGGVDQQQAQEYAAAAAAALGGDAAGELKQE